MVALSVSANAADYTVWNGEGVVEDVYSIDSDSGIMPLSAGSISGGYGVGTANTAIFGGLISKLPYGVHYVYWREGQYTYRLAYGRELSLSGSRFSGSSVRLVTYNTYSGSSSQAIWSSVEDSNFSLSAGKYLVWSDLGDYPQLETGKGVRDYAHAAAFGVAVLLLFALLRGFRSSIWGRYC